MVEWGLLPERLETALSYEQLVALLNARQRRKSDEMEWEWTHVRAIVKALGGDLPPLHKRKAKKPTAAELDRGLASLRAQGVRIKDVPPK